MNQLETLISFINRNYDSLFLIQVLSIILLCGLLLFIWNITRKKYRNLRGEIPADALNNYLDSLKQNSNAVNSTSLKSMSPEPTGTPSVMPLNNMEASGQSVAVSSGVSSEELNEKNAEISQLRSLLESKGNQISELENKLVEASMTSSEGGGEPDAAVVAKVQGLEKEKAELEEKLKVYEVIDDDIAELSKLRKENEELRKSLGQDAPPPPAPEPEVEEPVAEEPVAEEPPADIGGDLDDMLGAMDEPAPETPMEEIAADAADMGGGDLDDLLGGGGDEPPAAPMDDMADMLGGDDIPVDGEADSIDGPVEEPAADVGEPEDAEEDGKSVEVKETDTPDDLLSQFEELLG